MGSNPIGLTTQLLVGANAKLCQSGTTGDGYNTATAAYLANASTSTRIIDDNGFAFGSLPAAAAVGSQVYVSNGTAGTATCNGSGTGTMAFRVNSGTPAWRCF